MIVRILPYEVGDGPNQMGLDLSLLDSIDAEPQAAALRFYAWRNPTLSLGYFQHYESARAEPRWRDVPIVRRPSGGGAIWHDADLTYALILPRSHPSAHQPARLYRAVHNAFAITLKNEGLDAYRRADRPSLVEPPRPGPFLCFLDHDREDILIEGHKILGSAQRRRPRAILQHGSLLLHTSAQTPELPGLDQLATRPIERITWIDQASRQLCQILDLQPRPDAPDPAERDAALRHSVATFAAPAWTERR